LITSLEQDQTDSVTSKLAAFDKLSTLLQQKGDIENAIQAVQDGVQLDPTNLDKLKQLGNLFQKRRDKDVKALVNGKQPVFDVKPVIKNGRTLVPARAIAEALGAKVTWDPSTQTVTFTKDNTIVTLHIGSKTITINGKTATIDVPAALLNGRTVVPVRFISEALNATVQWVPDGQVVNIVTDTSSDQTPGSSVTNSDSPTSTNASAQ
jgi:hypothetical protein